MLKTAIIYSRVSSDEQKEKGYSLDDQEEKLSRYCLQNNIQVVQKFREDCSAKEGFDRPKFRVIKELITKRQVKPDYILVTQWSRFSRNALDCMNELKAFEKYKVKVNAIEQWIEGGIPENQYLFMIYITTPEVENKRLSLRTIAGMRQALKMGHYISKPPRGYDRALDQDKKPTIVPNKEAAFIVKAFELVSTGIYTMDEIRKRLNAEGFKCSKNHMPNILRNWSYCGFINIKEYNNEPETMIKGKFEEIVSPELFNRVQKIINNNSKSKTQIRKLRSDVPLRGLISCRYCGTAMCGATSTGNGGKYSYYECYKCRKDRYSVGIVDQEIQVVLKELKISPEVGDLFVAKFKDRMNESAVKQKAEKEKIDTKLEELSANITKLEEGYHILKTIPLEIYTLLKKDYNRKMSDLSSKKIELDVSGREVLTKVKSAANLMLNIDEVYNQGDLDTKRRIVGVIFPQKLWFENKRPRTIYINEAALRIANKINTSGEVQKKMETFFGLHPTQAPSPGLEPGTP
jgi:site-specific DNA recombinase